MGIDDNPAVFGRRQIGAGRGLQLVAEQGGAVDLRDVPADADACGYRYRIHDVIHWYRKHRGDAAWRRVGRTRAYRTRRHRVAGRQRTVAGNRSHAIHASVRVGGFRVNASYGIGVGAGRRGKICAASWWRDIIPAALAVIGRMTRNNVAFLKLEPRHQALKLRNEIVDPGDRDRRAVALVRPDGHVRDGERHERIDIDVDGSGGGGRRHQVDFLARVVRVRDLDAPCTHEVGVTLSRNKRRRRGIEIRQRIDVVGIGIGTVSGGVRVERANPAAELHFVDQVVLDRNAIGSRFRFRPLELHVVVRREDGGEFFGGARGPNARGFLRHVDDRRPGGVAPEDTAHGNDIENVGLAPLEIRVEIGQRPGFPEFLGHLIARQLAIDLEVREGSAIRRGRRGRPLEQCVIVRRQHRGEVSRRRRSLNVYLSAFRRNVHGRRSGWLGGAASLNART